jgi:hypothetical protein
MRAALLIGAAAAAVAGGAQAAEVFLDGVVARVVVIPENRADILVDVRSGSAPVPQLRVRREGPRTVVEGGLEVNQCRGDQQNRTVRTREGREFLMAAAPLVTIRAPLDVTINTRKGAVQGEVGPTRNLSLASGGCSTWRVADVAGSLQLQQSGGARATAGRARTARLTASGGGSIQAGAVGELRAEASGGGRVRVVSVAGPLDADASGGGVIRADSAAGQVTAEASGGGGVDVGGGRSGALQARASGGGWVDHGGSAGSLSAQASGGGWVKVAAVSGPIHQRTASGGGRVIVGR